jgi:hypothetical protein
MVVQLLTNEPLAHPQSNEQKSIIAFRRWVTQFSLTKQKGLIKLVQGLCVCIIQYAEWW